MPDVNQEHEKCSKCGGEKDAEGWCRIYCADDVIDVSMSSDDIVTACKEWVLKTHGLIARNPVLVVNQETSPGIDFNMLFVGIPKPKDAVEALAAAQVAEPKEGGA
jgi:hypothetical protein